MNALSQAALWFGASVSLAEIWSGGLLAPLGLVGGQTANLVGHLIGGLGFLGAAWLSARDRRGAMAVLDRPFGARGPRLFAVLNIIQLVGWTAVMVVTAAESLQTVAQAADWGEVSLAGKLAVGLLLALWVAAGWSGVKTLNLAAVVLLLGLTLLITVLLVVHPATEPGASGPPLPLPLGIDWVLALPISWLPLVGDYTSRSQNPKTGAWAATLGYAAGSLWMFSTGLLGASSTGQSDPTALLVSAGFGAAGLAVILLSTVTTAFLDVQSAGVSATVLVPRWKTKPAALVFTVLGVGAALVFPMDQYVTFLTALGAVFGPLYAVVLTEAFVVRRGEPSRVVRAAAFGAWAVGTVLALVLSSLNCPWGSTLPSALAAAVLYFILRQGVLK